MRQTPEEIDAAASRALAWRQKREELDNTITEETASSLSRFAVGGYLTNPEIKASLGLANITTDAASVHQAIAKSARASKAYVPNAATTTVNAESQTEQPGTEYSLVDLFRSMADPVNRRRNYAPDWYETVDPGGLWRSIEVPDRVSHAKEFLNLTEPQLIKMFLSSDFETWSKIPGVYDTGYVKGERVAPFDYETFKAVRAKFPTYTKLLDTARTLSNPQAFKDPTVMESIFAEIGPTAAMFQDVVAAPFRLAGFFAPDFMKPVANIPKAAVRAVATGFVAGAQLSKNTIEYGLTHPNGLSTLMAGPVVGMPGQTQQDYDDYVNTVIRGNILTQIARQVKDPNQQVDLGSGFFPEGKAREEAIKAHDAGLPKIAGQTFTVGRATIEPLIRENWIDRDGFAAQLISGTVDAVFTVGTDPALFIDPIQSLMKAFNLERVVATRLLNSRKADIVRDAWIKDRAAAGQSTVIGETFDMVYDPSTGRWSMGATNIPADDIPQLAGVLPRGTTLPDDVERAAQELAQKELAAAGPLAALDSPPDNLPYLPLPGSKEQILNEVGLIDAGDGVLRPNPMAIDNMINTPSGKRVLEQLASYPNAGALYDAFLGNIPPGAAVQIQEVVDAARAANTAVDLKQIHRILVDGVLSADPMYGVQYVPSYMQQVVKQTGKQIAYYANRVSRQLATMPGSTFFSFDDPIGSLNDMNRIMVIMKVPVAERHAFLSRAMIAVTKEGPGARFDLANQWMKTVVGPALRRNGVPEEWVDVVTSWAGWSDRVHTWSMDAIGRGYPTPWLKDGTGEVLRTVDALNQGFIMIPPDQLQQVIRETTNLWRIFKPVRGNRVVERLLREQITKKLMELQQKWLKPAALGAPLPIRMVSRILPDELLRVAATGHMSPESMKILSAGGHLNYTTYGEVITPMKEIVKLFPVKEHLDELALQLDAAVRAGDAGLANDIAAEIAKIEAKYGTTKEIMDQIQTYQVRANTILPGLNRTAAQQIEGLMAVERMDPRVVKYERNLNVQRAYKDTDPEKWVVGTSRDIVKMSQSLVYPEVAEAMLTGNPQALIDLPQRLMYGDLRPLLTKLTKTFGNMNPLMPLDSMPGITQYIRTVVHDITTRTAGDPVLLGAIQTGELGGSSIGVNIGSDLWGASKSLQTFVRENLLTNPATDNIPAPFHSTEVVQGNAEADRMFTKLFSIYRDTSAKYARNPFMFYEKWKRIIELIPIMDPVEAQKMLRAIERTDAPDYLKDSIRRAIPEASGTATRKQIELLGEMHGHQRVSDVLYDYSKKSYFGSRHGLLFGFFDAWVEQWSVWARQIFEQPSLIEKGRLAKEGLTNTGILFKDEDSGQNMVAVPFSREVYKWLGLNAAERIPAKNLTLLSQAVPGLFGFGALAFDSVAPKEGFMSGLRNIFQPYGDPETQGKLAEYVSAPWLQQIAGGATRLLGDKPSQAFDIFDNVGAMLLGQVDERMYAMTSNAILNNIASNSNEMPLSTVEREKLLRDVDRKTNYLMILKGFFRVLSPTASMTKYFTDIGSENVTAGAVMDDLRKFSEESPDYATAVTKLLNKYGNDTWVFLAGATDAVPGMAPTKEYATWLKDNRAVVENFPLAGGYLGPQGGEYDPTAYSQQRSAGYRKPKDIKTRQERALNNYAWAIYKNTANTQIREQAKYGLSEEQTRSSAEFKANMKKQADELKRLFPTWNPRVTAGESGRELLNQLIEVEKMVQDKNVLRTPAGRALKEYWDFRTRNVDEYIKLHPDMANESWKESSRSTGFRAGLEQQGEYLAYRTPEFKAIWDNVLSREFLPSELG